jgi:hypothetical protein
MSVTFALHSYAKVVIVTARRLLITVKIIPKDKVQYELTGKTAGINTCYSTKYNSGAYPLYYKGELRFYLIRY